MYYKTFLIFFFFIYFFKKASSRANNAVQRVNCLVEDIDSLHTHVFSSPWVTTATWIKWVLRKKQVTILDGWQPLVQVGETKPQIWADSTQLKCWRQSRFWTEKHSRHNKQMAITAIWRAYFAYKFNPNGSIILKWIKQKTIH